MVHSHDKEENIVLKDWDRDRYQAVYSRVEQCGMEWGGVEEDGTRVFGFDKRVSVCLSDHDVTHSEYQPAE